MADHEDEDEDLQMAIRMSLQGSSPKRSKPIDKKEEEGEESPEIREARLQRELRAAAAERRIAMIPGSKLTTAIKIPEKDEDSKSREEEPKEAAPGIPDLDQELSPALVEQLFSMLFGSDVSAGILSRWSNQGIRFSSDPDTSIGLVQHEGGPCGVLAAIQAFVLKYLIFLPNDCMMPQTSRQDRLSLNPTNFMGNFMHITENMRERALVHSMVEILFLCGKKGRATIATLNISANHLEGSSESSESEQIEEEISGALEVPMIESASDLQKLLRVSTFSSRANTFNRLVMELPVFRSRMGAMLFLISALLSRGLDSVQDDRDDPNLPLVTAPFGHASQEIVNLLLCGEAAPNVFDGRMDLGGGMFLKGIPGSVEVGFLTLLESLNFCKVGQYLKCPRWPIWVIGSESHYTVLFALDTSVQDENELEQRESSIKRAFDAHDQSGGGGFIGVDGFHKVLAEMGINLPSDKVSNLCSSGFIVWSEFWQALLDLDKDLGGLKDSATHGKKQFDIYHFNGIAKSVSNGNQPPSGGSETPAQRPRLCKLGVIVPPSWTQEEYLSDVATSERDQGTGKNGSDEVKVDRQLPEPSQHAPLVDCIRTRWSRAVCRWDGDPPSIV